MLDALDAFLRCGTVLPVRRARRESWQPQVVLTISDMGSLVQRVVPFGDRYLLPCSKRRQFVSWRQQLLAYLASPRRAAGTCRADGCDGRVRGQGLCRSHYYRATGY